MSTACATISLSNQSFSSFMHCLNMIEALLKNTIAQFQNKHIFQTKCFGNFIYLQNCLLFLPL
jgi:hypothetical protein